MHSKYAGELAYLKARNIDIVIILQRTQCYAIGRPNKFKIEPLAVYY